MTKNTHSFSAILYENDGTGIMDEKTFDTAKEAITFAKSRYWDNVINNFTGRIIWSR